MATCYRHPNRETAVSCSSCGRPICPDCMTPTPVGMRCPECAKQRTKVKTAATISTDPLVAYTLIGINVVVFLIEVATGSGLATGASGPVVTNGALFGPAVENGDYWRLVTGGFLHAGILHIAFNMYFLYILGQMMEPAIGHVRFAVIYFVSLLAGSFGALLVTPDSLTVGASGAIFGLMGAAIVEARARGIDPWRSGLMLVLVLNLGLTFVIGGISIGGHIGGLIGGTLCALVIEYGGRRSQVLGWTGCAVIGIGSVAGALAVAGGSGIG